MDVLPEAVIVPEAGRRLRCTLCKGKQIETIPAWHTRDQGDDVASTRLKRAPADASSIEKPPRRVCR